jgi:hypothetical protein
MTPPPAPPPIRAAALAQAGFMIAMSERDQAEGAQA